MLDKDKIHPDMQMVKNKVRRLGTTVKDEANDLIDKVEQQPR
jgi:hypothetical protein